MPPTPTARPVARLATELRITGSGQAAIGFAGLLVAIFAGDVSPARAFVPFAVVMLLIGGLSWWSTRWMRDGRPAPPKAPDAVVESPRDTMRRSLVGLTLAVVAVGLVGAAGAGLAAVLGGVVAAVGAVDLINHRHVRAREQATGEAVYRELGGSPFSAGRRPLYTLPLNESTLAM